MLRKHLVTSALFAIMFNPPVLAFASPINVALISGFLSSSGATDIEGLRGYLDGAFGAFGEAKFKARSFDWTQLDDAAAFLSGDRDAVIIGHSLGGETARQLAQTVRDANGSVAKLIQIDTVEYDNGFFGNPDNPDINDTNTPNQRGVPSGVSALNFYQLQTNTITEPQVLTQPENIQGTRNVNGATNINTEEYFFDTNITHTVTVR